MRKTMAQTVSFNFSDSPNVVSGWINVHGDPSLSVITATDASTGISINSVATANWVQYSRTNAAYDGGGVTNGTYFPAAVMLDQWFQYNPAGSGTAYYNQAIPQLILSGLNPDSVYKIKISSSMALGFDSDPSHYTIVGSTVYGPIDLNTNNNTANGAEFDNIAPDSAGHFKIYINTIANTEAADISGLQLIGTGTSGVTPVVRITSPANNDILGAGGNFTISATASEIGGSIAKVEFFAGGNKIGQSTASPYSITWTDPDDGHYTLTAKATDAGGLTSTSTIMVSVESLSYFWSTTGNSNTGGDTSFVGTVDSNRLTFRTKNIERMTISAIGNVGIGTDSPTAQLHTTGSVRLAGLGNDSSNIQPRMLVSDSSGKLYYRSIATGGLIAGQGLGQTAGGVALGDSIPGPGPHSFNSNRYQYLNGHMYSIGGSVNDPVNHPVLRTYNNGDLAAGTTMDRGVFTGDQTGLRYYAKPGYLQIGASDRLDTTQNAIVYGIWPSSALVINTDSANSIKGQLMNTVFAADMSSMDSLTTMEDVLVAGENCHFNSAMGYMNRTVLAGYALNFTGQTSNSVISGANNTISQQTQSLLLTGFENSTQDSVYGSLVSGGNNRFGGRWQLVSGLYLVNRTPAGAAIGNSNVDFSTLPYTGTRGVGVPGLSGYPLLAVGNGSATDGSVRSNALTVMFNGRTQINTTGFSNSLSQAQVTPQAALDVVSTNTGVLLPRLTTAQRNAIVSGDLQNGLLLYNTDSSVFQYYNGSAWNSVGGGGAGSGRWLFSGGTAYDSLDNIAIGTSNPQGYKLAVNGTAIFTKIRVKTASNWPDYVFKKGYMLAGLDELERYIRSHHHLPGMVAAKEAEQGGVDVADQQTALLKNVEEHALYLIKQNKQLMEQNQRLTEQNQRLDEQQRKMDELTACLKTLNEKIDGLTKENERLKNQSQHSDH